MSVAYSTGFTARDKVGEGVWDRDVGQWDLYCEDNRIFYLQCAATNGTAARIVAKTAFILSYERLNSRTVDFLGCGEEQ